MAAVVIVFWRILFWGLAVSGVEVTGIYYCYIREDQGNISPRFTNFLFLNYLNNHNKKIISVDK